MDDLRYPAHERRDFADIMVGVATRNAAFIAFNAAESHCRRRVEPAREVQSALQGAAAGALARDANFQQHIERHGMAATLRPVFDQGQLVGRVHQKPDAQIRVARKQVGQGVQIGIGHNLVGNDDAAHARFDANTHLVQGGKADAPGTSGLLHLKQLRRHGGFAVRRQGHAFAPCVRLHPGQVVLQRAAVDYRYRKRQVVG